jgi:dihydropteroate synthase-like protein
MEKLILITGMDAYNDLISIDFGESLKKQYEMIFERVPVKIAAFISKENIIEVLNKYEIEPLNHWVIVSGLIPWDMENIEGKFKGRVKKGPKFLSNLKEILKIIHPKDLSGKEPADKIIKFDKRNHLKEVIEQRKSLIKDQISKGNYSEGFQISSRFPDVIFSEALPPLIIAEIVDAPLYTDEELINKVQYFLDSGADVIDLGCLVNKDSSHRIFELVSLIKSKFNCPVSIDSLNVNEIKQAVTAGADLVLSISLDNLADLHDLPKDISLVCIPIENNQKESTINGKLAKLVMLGNRLNVLGFTKILLDPILDPPIKPGLSESLETYFLMRDALQSVPGSMPKPMIFMGIGNVTELVDSDSQGMNMLLAILAVENNVAGVLTTEYSNKMRGSIKELRNAIDLAYYAKINNQTPINLGITAFRAKGKQKYSRSNYLSNFQAKIIDTDQREEHPIELDKEGFFKIYVHYPEHLIIVEFYRYNKENEPERIYKGKNPIQMYKGILKDGIIGSLSHAAYIGKELTKAKYALDYGIDYTQDGI